VRRVQHGAVSRVFNLPNSPISHYAWGVGTSLQLTLSCLACLASKQASPCPQHRITYPECPSTAAGVLNYIGMSSQYTSRVVVVNSGSRPSAYTASTSSATSSNAPSYLAMNSSSTSRGTAVSLFRSGPSSRCLPVQMCVVV
jgi:hypothetical protein